MVDPVITAIGGLIGAAVGLLFSDPYRDNAGRYQSRGTGYQSWIFQAIFGAFLGAILTNVAYTALIAEPVFTIMMLFLGTWFTYRTYVDPR